MQQVRQWRMKKTRKENSWIQSEAGTSLTPELMTMLWRHKYENDLLSCDCKVRLPALALSRCCHHVALPQSAPRLTTWNLTKLLPSGCSPLVWSDGQVLPSFAERESSPTSALSRRGGVKVCSSENQCWVISKTNMRSILLASNAISRQDEELAKYPGPSKVSLRGISQPWPDPPGWTNEKPSSQEPDAGILRW